MIMKLEVIERRLLGLDDEVHRLLQYIYEQKKIDINSEIKDYENLKKLISEHMKEPIDPTAEIRNMREKQYGIEMKVTIDSYVLAYAFIEPGKEIYKDKHEEFKTLHIKADDLFKDVILGKHELIIR